jgi:serine protease Do
MTAGLLLFGKPLQSHFANPPAPKAISTVLLSDDTGHGSGVHLGHGFILTAAHVVEDHSEMEVTDSDGHKQIGKVLWANKTYDVALIRVDSAAALAASPLNCSAAPPKIGDEVVAIGNPLSIGTIRTYGRIAALAEERGPFATAIMVDLTVAPGMSGGGVFDKAGNLVGIVNAFATAMPFGYAISYVVPISAACTLMGRG